jgi:hypothetical protein
MDVYVSTVAGEPARSCTDAHADGSTFVSRKATISGFATDPTRAFLANATKSDRNHTITFIAAVFPCDEQFHLMPDKFHFMPDKFHLMPDPTLTDLSPCSSPAGAC